MIARFDDAAQWHAAITAAVVAGLLFNAYQCGGGFAIEYTGGY